MKDHSLKDNIIFEDETERVIFNHYSFCELLKHIMVNYGDVTYQEAHNKLQSSFLIDPPTSSDHVSMITHELEFHWAMFALHGDMYWTKGIPSDFIDFKEEYFAWEADIKLTHNLKDCYQFIDL